MPCGVRQDPPACWVVTSRQRAPVPPPPPATAYAGIDHAKFPITAAPVNTSPFAAKNAFFRCSVRSGQNTSAGDDGRGGRPLYGRVCRLVCRPSVPGRPCWPSLLAVPACRPCWPSLLAVPAGRPCWPSLLRLSLLTVPAGDARSVPTRGARVISARHTRTVQLGLFLLGLYFHFYSFTSFTLVGYGHRVFG